MSKILMLNKYNCAVKKDDDNMLLLGYDIENDEYKDYTEGILREVCQDMADSIEETFSIKVKDYGVIIIEEKYDLTAPFNNTIYYREDDVLPESEH